MMVTARSCVANLFFAYPKGDNQRGTTKGGHRQKGKSPDHQLRPQNNILVLKHVRLQKQPGGLPSRCLGKPLSSYL